MTTTDQFNYYWLQVLLQYVKRIATCTHCNHPNKANVIPEVLEESTALICIHFNQDGRFKQCSKQLINVKWLFVA